MADQAMMDDQELGEREEAAIAYSEEDNQYFVDYVESCVKESKDSSKDVRDVWHKCWDAYRNRIDYSEKHDWQSQVTTNDPFTACKRAVAIVRKAFDKPDYFSIDTELNSKDDFMVFTEDMLETWFGLSRARFPIVFNDSAEMGFAVGQSKEIIPRWENGKGLRFDSIEPWKIYRDPDAEPRDPWSGMYWIHEDFYDIWKIKNDAKKNGYINLDKMEEIKSDDVPEKAAWRKEQFFERTKYRKGTLFRDFWGTILDNDGELLLPDGHLIIAGGAVIKPPEINPYVKMRWPGISFSPFAHLTRFEGRGILEGAIQLWWMQCNLMSLFMDDLNWAVNKMREIRYEFLDNPADTECIPGKEFLIAYGVSPEAEIIKEIPHQASISEVLPIMQMINQKWEAGTMVTNPISGLPGDRSRVTLGEVDIKRSESLSVFDSIGYDLELGAIYAILATHEVLMMNWNQYSTPSPVQVMGERGFKFGTLTKQERRDSLSKSLNINVSGISAQIREAEHREAMLNYVSLLFKAPPTVNLGKYNKPYELNNEVLSSLGFKKPKFVMDDNERQQADQVEQQSNEQISQMQQKMMDMQAQLEQTKVATDGETKRRKAGVMEFKAITDAAIKQDESNKPEVVKSTGGKTGGK